MIKSLWETYRRRQIQQAYNTAHGITPTKAISNIKSLDNVKTDKALEPQESFVTRKKVKKLKRMTKKEKEIILTDLRHQLETAVANREFETAASLRDQIKSLDGEMS